MRNRSFLERDFRLEFLAIMLLLENGASKRILVYWNHRLRSTAGCAYPRRIELNPKLKKISWKEIHRTLKHELAHVLARHRAHGKKIDVHGEEWRKACKDLGIPGEQVFHDILPRICPKRRYVYACKCGVKWKRVRPTSKKMACLRCCKKYNGGKYSHKFQVKLISKPK